MNLHRMRKLVAAQLEAIRRYAPPGNGGEGPELQRLLIGSFAMTHRCLREEWDPAEIGRGIGYTCEVGLCLEIQIRLFGTRVPAREEEFAAALSRRRVALEPEQVILMKPGLGLELVRGLAPAGTARIPTTDRVSPPDVGNGDGTFLELRGARSWNPRMFRFADG